MKKLGKSVLLSTLAALAFGAVAVGTTYALFTSKAEASVEVTTGKVAVSLELGALSGTSPSKISEDGTIPADATTDITPEADGSLKFVNGGTAMIDGTKVIIENMTPGDSVKVPLTIKNESTVAIKYRGVSTITGSDEMEYKFEGIETKWTKKAAGEQIAAADSYVTISLPATATKQSEERVVVSVAVEAVQGNAEVYDDVKADSISDAFSDVDFSYNTSSSKATVIDGHGSTTINDWTDAWFSSDMKVKGVTFKQGATFSAKSEIESETTITFENCTFYPCDQAKIDTSTALTHLSNSGQGLCLDVETSNNANVKVVVKNCTFIGEDDVTLEREGYKTWTYSDSGTAGDGSWTGSKSRGHAIAINAIAGTGTASSVLIDGNTMSGILGHALQLYTFDYPITVSNNKIESWGRNKQTEAGTDSDSAIRGTLGTGGTLTLTNNYFGLDESESPKKLYHVNVNNYSGNTDHTRLKGTY